MENSCRPLIAQVLVVHDSSSLSSPRSNVQTHATIGRCLHRRHRAPPAGQAAPSKRAPSRACPPCDVHRASRPDTARREQPRPAVPADREHRMSAARRGREQLLVAVTLSQEQGHRPAPRHAGNRHARHEDRATTAGSRVSRVRARCRWWSILSTRAELRGRAWTVPTVSLCSWSSTAGQRALSECRVILFWSQAEIEVWFDLGCRQPDHALTWRVGGAGRARYRRPDGL